MVIESSHIIILVLVIALIGGFLDYRQSKSLWTSFQVANGIIIISAAIFLFISLELSNYTQTEIPKEFLDQSAVLGLIFALITLALENLKELKMDKPFKSLKSKIKAIQDKNTIEGDQNTQKIIAQINHLEESQKTLAAQIQSLKDSIPAAKPSEEPQDDEDPRNG